MLSRRDFINGTFGAGGKLLTTVGDDDLEMLVLQSSGKILVGGSAAPTAFGVDSDFLVMLSSAVSAAGDAAKAAVDAAAKAASDAGKAAGDAAKAAMEAGKK